MRSVFVAAKVLALGCSYAYPCCSTCRRKVRSLNEGDEERMLDHLDCCKPEPADNLKKYKIGYQLSFHPIDLGLHQTIKTHCWLMPHYMLWCSHCEKDYKKESVQYRYHVNLTVADNSGIARVTVFGKSWEAFFGITATNFCRYVVECKSTKSLQGVSIDQVVVLSIEKCLLGSIVQLVFRVNNACTKNTSAFRGSPFVLKNIIPQSTNVSRIPGISNNCKIPEFLASYIIRSKSEKRMKMVIDVFVESVSCNPETTCTTDDKHLVSFNIRDTVGECSVKDTSNKDALEESTCSTTEQIESSWNAMQGYSGTDLVLSIITNDNNDDDESKTNFIAISDPMLDESFAKEPCKTVSDYRNNGSFENLCKEKEEKGVSSGTSSNFPRSEQLSHLQQSFFGAFESFESNNFPTWTGIAMGEADKHESNSVDRTTVVNTIAVGPKCSEMKTCSSATNNSISESSFPSIVHQPRTNGSTTRVLLDKKVTIDNLKSRFENCVDTFLPITKQCNAEMFKPNSILTNCQDSSSEFEVDLKFDSPSLEDLDVFLAQFNYPCSASKTGQDGEEATQPNEENVNCLRPNNTDKVYSVDVIDQNNLITGKNSPEDFKSGEIRAHYSSPEINTSDPVFHSKHSQSSKFLLDSHMSFGIEKRVNVDTPEVYSSEIAHGPQSYLSSTPISHFENNSGSSSTCRTTKWLNSFLKGYYNHRKKNSKTLWKYITGMEKRLIPCSEIPSINHNGLAFDGESENLEMSSILFFDNRSAKKPLTDQDNTITLVQHCPAKKVTDDPLSLFGSELQPIFKKRLTRSKIIHEPVLSNTHSPAAISVFTENDGDNQRFVDTSLNEKPEKKFRFIRRVVDVIADSNSPTNLLKSKNSDSVKTLNEQRSALSASSCCSPLLFSQSHS